MSKWIIVFLLVFSSAAFAEVNTMEAWVKDKFGLEAPKLERKWESLTLVPSCEYEWYVRWNDMKVQVRDKDENFYRLYYQDQTLILDYKKDFVISKWELF